jgi:hypothetical protein
MVPAATAYGRHLLIVLRAAISSAPTLFHAEELELAARLAALPTAAADFVSRFAQRRVEAVPAARVAEGAGLDAAVASGWIQREEDVLRLAPAARSLCRAALLLAFADDRDDLSVFPRLGLERLALPERSPFGAALRAVAGGQPPSSSDRPLFADRVALDEYLAARDARAAGPSPEAFAAALAAVEAAAGRPQRLLDGRFAAIHHWTALLWECRETLGAEDAGRPISLRALRRAPLAPPLARRLWDAVHRRCAARSGRRMAEHLATFAIWSEGERRRWQARAREPGSPRPAAGPWRQARVRAWLDKALDGAVLAQGEGVEAHALRRLRAQGWDGMHAEGGFWLALAALLFDDVIYAPVPGAWPGPLQVLPLDWGRWGFAARRREAIAARSAELVRDPLGKLERAYAAAGSLLPGLIQPPRRDCAVEVCRRMPRLTLARLLQRVLADPKAASGLPDLIAWRGDELALWEVKSPRDQLSDAQRAWLGWLDREGIAAGVLRIDARASEQQALFAAPAKPAAPAAPPRSPRAPRRDGACLALAFGTRIAALAAGATLPDAPALALEPALRVDRWSGALGAGAVAAWDRPVTAVVGLPADAVYAERREGRRVVERRWFPLPRGWALPALIADEADEAGGVAPRATVLMRASGWLLPAEFAALEPVVAPLDEISAIAGGAAPQWLPHPEREPPRPERDALAWGLWPDLAAQLALIGSSPYRLSIGHEPQTIELAVAPTLSCLWTVGDPRIRRADLQVA